MVVRFIAENLALDQLGRTRRVIYTVLWIGVLSTLGVSLTYLLVLYGVPSLLFPSVFMLLGGQILGLVCGDYYWNGTGILIPLRAAKVGAFC